MSTAKAKPKAVRQIAAKAVARKRARPPSAGPDYAVNRAIREIAAEQDPPLTAREVADYCYVDVETVWYWWRANPSRAPKSALALLCYQLGIPQPTKLLSRGR